jgi:hypothetical protein
MHETNRPLLCTQCGKSNPGSSLFCDQCGSPVRLTVQPVAQQQAAKSFNAAHSAAIVFLVVVALFVVVVFVIAPKGADTVSSKPNTTNNSTLDLAEYCKNFAFDEQCPNHDQYRTSPIAHPAPDQLHAGEDPSSVCLEMVRNRGEVDEFGTTVTGTVRNNCGKDFSYVQVTFKLFDRSGNVVGTALANQNDLKAGETWKFKAFGTPAAHHDTFLSITAY